MPTKSIEMPARPEGSAGRIAIVDDDRFGHDAGDRALQGVARALEGAAQRTHTVGRYGGEEFVAILPGTTLEGARRWAEALRGTVERESAAASGDAEGPLTASVGVAALVAPDGTGDAGALLRAADAALYEAKSRGRNRVVAAGGLRDAA